MEQKYCGCGRKAMPKGWNKDGSKRWTTWCWVCREQARAQKGHWCVKCGFAPNNRAELDIDHIDGDRSNNAPENVQTLCRPCHIEKTKASQDWKKKSDMTKGQKHCHSCKTDKPVSEYYKRPDRKDGLQVYCIECQKQMGKKNREHRKDIGPIITIDKKTCRTCNTTKPISQFGKKTQSLDGHLPYCKPCWVIYVNKAQMKAKRKAAILI